MRPTSATCRSCSCRPRPRPNWNARRWTTGPYASSAARTSSRCPTNWLNTSALCRLRIRSSTSPKSNASYLAVNKAREDVRAGRTLAVPAHLRDANYKGAEAMGHGADYQYSHDHPGGWVDQHYLPEARRYYEPVDRGHEAVIRQRMEELRRPRGEGEAGPT